MLKIYFSIILAELKRIFTTYSICSIMVLGPFVYFFFYPQPYNNEVLRSIPIGVINLDNTNESRILIRELSATDAIVIKQYFSSLDNAKEAMAKREIYGILLIPFEFEKKLLAGSQSPIAFYSDASYAYIDSLLSVAVNAVTSNIGATVSINRQIEQGVDPSVAQSGAQPFLPVVSTLYNPALGYATFAIPPVFILILHQMLLVGVVLVNVKAHKTASEQRLIRSYPHPGCLTCLLITGKMTVYFFLYSFYFWFFILFSSYWYKLPQLGSFTSLFLLSLFMIAVVSFAGFVISFLTKKMEDAAIIIIPISIMIFFTAGLSWPFKMMPTIYEKLSHLIPAIPLMNAVVKIKTMGADWSNAQTELLTLVIQLIIFAGLSFYLMHRYVNKTLNSKEVILLERYDE